MNYKEYQQWVKQRLAVSGNTYSGHSTYGHSYQGSGSNKGVNAGITKQTYEVDYNPGQTKAMLERLKEYTQQQLNKEVTHGIH